MSARIGRIVTNPRYRSQGLAADLMKRALLFIREEGLGRNVRIAAQRHLSNYYTGLGFQEIGDPYVEDGIAHADMMLVL